MQLKGLNLQEKLALLNQWFKKKIISREAFEYFSNLWINRESRKLAGPRDLVRTPKENFERNVPRSTTEGKIQMLIDKLRSDINDYVTNRAFFNRVLSDKELEEFKRYVSTYFYIYPAKICRLLTIGLRYPDVSKKINKFCCEWIDKGSMVYHKDYYNDPHFWGLLWEDGNFVPMDAIRLMLKKNEDGTYRINERFDPHHLTSLRPFIVAQRDKEIERLKWAQMREDCDQEAQVPRKIKRVGAFNTLLGALDEYCKEK